MRRITKPVSGSALAGGIVAILGGIAMPVTALAAAPVEVTSFTISPGCTHPGGTLTATDQLRTTTQQNQTFYVQTQTQYFGFTIQTSPAYGPYIVGPNTTSTTVTPTSVSIFTPPGSYTTVFGVGPTPSDAMGWSTRSATWSALLAPFC
jgi:hypothetical protein